MKFKPMLAKEYSKFKHKLEPTFFAQPKLDGIRATWYNGKLWSRQGKEITSVPHINEALKDVYYIVDGELYCNQYKHDFSKIASIVRRTKNLHEDHKLVEFHVFAVIDSNNNYMPRAKWYTLGNDYLRIVQSTHFSGVNRFIELDNYYNMQLELGYEGIMVYNNTRYEQKRTHNLLKRKPVNERDYKIVGFIEGKGKLRNCLGALVCETDSGNTFKVKMAVPEQELFDLWQNKEDLIGKMVRVEYQNITVKNKVPRFPIGVRIRND